MATSKRQSFQEILGKGISFSNPEKTISIDKIFIPRIQRSYAQGRQSEYEVRSNFLKDIFDSLCNNHILELSFIFGSKQPLSGGNSGYGFELLDGQQRITTLFLLHWYLWMKEHTSGEEIPVYLNKFTYETRDTSTQFISKIVERHLSFEENKPSKVIKANKWFTPIFNCDATVCSMLTMLDTIDENYKKCGHTGLYENLNNLQFYVLYLEQFELNDELYIKMNSRGLKLTPFENFKAALIRFMKEKGGDFSKDVEYCTPANEKTKMPYYLRFSTKMDTVWNDIFWELPALPNGEVKDVVEINNLEKDKKFFRFFIRYFFTKFVLNYKWDDNMDLGVFLYNNTQKEGELIPAESQYALETRLVSWDNYQNILENLGYNGICKIEKVLDIFAKYHEDINRLIISNPYKTWNWDISDDIKNYTLSNRVVFATIIEFIEMIPDGKDFLDSTIQNNLKKLFRIMWNVIENIKIEDVKPAINVIKGMSEIIHLNGAVDDDLYKAINIKSDLITTRNNQLIEEIDKAKKIASNYRTDPNWENSIMQAERHPFFNGMICFFFDDSISTSDELKKRADVIGELFDVNGITSKYRNNHILIRALISKMNFWDGVNGLKNKYITEKAEKEGYLKILLRTQGANDLFCNYFNSSFTTMDEYLQDVVENAQWSNPSELGYSRVFNRLVNDEPPTGTRTIELFNQMFQLESSKGKPLSIIESQTYGIILAFGTRAKIDKEKLLLDTERHLIIKKLTDNESFVYVDSEQEDNMTTDLQDVWGIEVSLKKMIQDSKGNNVTIFVEFGAQKEIKFYIENNHTEISPIQDEFEVQANNRYKYKTSSQIKYDSFSNYNTILSVINEIEDKIKKL